MLGTLFDEIFLCWQIGLSTDIVYVTGGKGPFERVFGPFLWCFCITVAWGLFLEGPEKFSHPESHSKILKVMITELFYSCIINRGSLHKRNFSGGIYTSPFSDTDELKMALRARKVSGAFKKWAPRDSLSSLKNV